MQFPRVVTLPQGAANPDMLAAAASSDGSLLVVGGFDGELREYNARNGFSPFSTCLNSARTAGQYLRSSISYAAFKPHGAAQQFSKAAQSGRSMLLVLGSDGDVLEYHHGSQCVVRGAKERTYADGVLTDEANQLFAAAWSPDGARYVTGGKDATPKVYDEDAKVAVRCLHDGVEDGSRGHTASIQSLRWPSPDVIVSGGWDYTVLVWDVRAARAQRRLYGPYLCGDGLDVSPDCRTLATASTRAKDQLELWDFSTFKKIATVQWPSLEPAGQPLTPFDGAPGAAAPQDTPRAQVIPEHGAAPESPSTRVADDARGDNNLFCVRYSPSGRYLAAGGSYDFRIFDMMAASPAAPASTDSPVVTPVVAGELQPGGGSPHAVFNVAWGPDSSWCAAVGARGLAKVVARD